MSVPSRVLLSFFREATAKLNAYPRDVVFVLNDEAGMPASLDSQRHLLLQVQLNALDNVVADASTEGLTVEDVQRVLRELGSNDDFSAIQGDADAGELSKKMAEMNEAARLAFVRGVLRSELAWDEIVKEDKVKKTTRKLRTSGDGEGPIDRDSILEFCGLSNAGVRLPEVQRYLRCGTKMTEPMNIDGKEMDKERQKAKTGNKDRLQNIQRLFFRAMGFDPDFAMNEVHRIFLSLDESGNESTDDPELFDAFAIFVSSMNVALTNATLSLCSDEGGELSDQDTGGVTRVVGVKYSEKLVAAEGGSVEKGAPSLSSMEQQVDAQQREQLAMAREAAAMQQRILEDLLSMSEEERSVVLREAKKAHDTFLSQALQKAPGPERILFMQSVGGDIQKQLVMHKLWEQMLNENGGKAPTIRNR